MSGRDSPAGEWRWGSKVGVNLQGTERGGRTRLLKKKLPVNGFRVPPCQWALGSPLPMGLALVPPSASSTIHSAPPHSAPRTIHSGPPLPLPAPPRACCEHDAAVFVENMAIGLHPRPRSRPLACFRLNLLLHCERCAAGQSDAASEAWPGREKQPRSCERSTASDKQQPRMLVLSAD